MTDRQLMQKIAAGDSEAATELVQRYGRRVYKFLLGWVHDDEDAWDMTQEVMMRVCRKAGSYNGSASLAAWIFTVARNHYFDSRRRKNFRVHYNAVDMAEIAPVADRSASSPDLVLMREEIAGGVKAAIDALPPRQKEVVQLRLLAELSLDEISTATGLSLGGVKSTLSNALRALRERLTDFKRGAYVHLR